MRIQERLIKQAATLTVLVVVCSSFGLAQGASLDSIVSALTKAQSDSREDLRAYWVLRQYEMHNTAKPDKMSTVTAEITFLPPGHKDYAIRAVQGGEGERVVRKVLDHESEIASQWQQTAFIPDNYRFTLLGDETLDGHHCYVLQLLPRRESRDLLRGKAWVDSKTFNVRQVQGEPAKSPSWWIKHVELTLRFEEVEGMWLQTGASASADIRLFGRHVLTARDLQYDTSLTFSQKPVLASGHAAPARSVPRVPPVAVVLGPTK